MKTNLLFAAGLAVLACAVLYVVGLPHGSSLDLVHLVPQGEAGLAMATLAANKLRDYQLGEKNELPMIGSDVLYQGAAAGLVAATGLARPLTAGDRFIGFTEAKADNASGAASAINANLVKRGRIELPVSGLLITDVGLPVYATDDDTFVLSPVGASFIGFVDRFVSSGVGIVAFDALNFVDPYEGWVHELKSANYTVDAEDSGKWIWVDTDGVVITLPAVEGIRGLRVGNIAGYGVAGVSVSPNALDMIEGPDITAADDKDIINTKATARRGDFVEIEQSDANGWVITRKRGTWAREA